MSPEPPREPPLFDCFVGTIGVHVEYVVWSKQLQALPEDFLVCTLSNSMLFLSCSFISSAFRTGLFLPFDRPSRIESNAHAMMLLYQGDPPSFEDPRSFVFFDKVPFFGAERKGMTPKTSSFTGRIPPGIIKGGWSRIHLEAPPA
jgi:hypothetical protein